MIVNKNRRSKKYQSFGDVFPYVAVTNDMIILDNPKRVTAIVEMYCSNYDDLYVMDERHRGIMTLLCDFPADTTVSTYFCKTFVPADAVLLQQSQLDIVNYMERNKYDYVMSELSPEYVVYMAITLSVGDNADDIAAIRSLGKKKKGDKKDDKKIGFTHEEILCYKQAQRNLNKVVKQMKAVVGGMNGTLLRLNDHQILQFLSKLMNHSYVSQVDSLTDIIQSDWNCNVPGIFEDKKAYIHYNDNFHAVLSLRANMRDSKMPTQTHSSMNMIFANKDLYNVPFVVHHCMTIPERSEGLSRARRRLNMIANREGFAQYFKMLEKTPEGLPPEKLRRIVEIAIQIVEEGAAKFVEQFFHVHLWNKTLGGLDTVYNTFDSTVRMTYKLKREKFNIKGAYFSLFPGNENVEKIRTTLPSFNVADFMPFDLPRWPYYALKNKWEMYYYNEMDSFSKIDMFDVRCPNHNAIVAGGSGSGKSFTEQDKLWQIMKYDPCVAIVDFGGEGQGSYLSFVKNLGGTYLEVSLDKPYSINPFEGAYYRYVVLDEVGDVKEDRPALIITTEDGQKKVEPGGVPDGLRHTSLMATLERLFKGKSKEASIPPTIRAMVVEELREYYKQEDNNINNTCSLSDFAEKHLKDNPSFVGEWNLYDRLQEFIGTDDRQGSYAKFFRTTDKIKNDDIVCFDMAGLSSHEELKAVMIPALVSMIMLNILNAPAKRHRRKVVIMDEAWRELQGGDMANFMQEMFRTIRKLNGQITIITQSIDDLLGSSSAQALMMNTSYYWLIGGVHNPPALRQIKAQGVGLTEYDIEVITHQENKKEFFLLTPYFAGKLRFYPTAQFKMLATTAPDDKIEIDRVRREVGVDYTSPEVMERLKDNARFTTEHHTKQH